MQSAILEDPLLSHGSLNCLGAGRLYMEVEAEAVRMNWLQLSSQERNEYAMDAMEKEHLYFHHTPEC